MSDCNDNIGCNCCCAPGQCTCTGSSVVPGCHECADPSQQVNLGNQCLKEQWAVNNVEASFTATCPSGFEGESITVVIPVGVIAAQPTEAQPDAQAGANELAALYAEQLATAELTCQGLYYNTPQTATVICQFGTNKQYTIAAGLYSSPESQDAANVLAYAAAVEQAQLLCEGSP